MVNNDYSNMSEEDIISAFTDEEISEYAFIKLLEQGRVRYETICRLIDSNARNDARDKKIEKEIYGAIANKASDDEKMLLFPKIIMDYLKKTLVLSLESEDKVFEVIDKEIEHDYIKTEIAKEKGPDSLRVRVLPLLKSEADRTEVIRSIDNDDKKIELLAEVKDENRKAEIIASLKTKSDEVKLQLWSNIEKEVIFPFFGFENSKVLVYRSLTDDDNKEEMLSTLDSEEPKMRVIASMKDDDRKIRLLSMIIYEHGRAQIIKSINDDDKKIQLLSDIYDEKNKTIIALTIKDKEKFQELLPKIGIKSHGKYNSFGLGPETTIGMEVECEGEFSEEVKEARKIFGWKTKKDGSLRDGVECISSVMHDNEEDIESIYGICSLLKNAGQSISDRCGGHIHIGAHILKSAEAYKNLTEMWCNVELPLYLISNEEGSVPRKGIEDYAKPFSPKLVESLEKGSINIQNEDDLNQIVKDLKLLQEERYSGINFFNIDYNNSKNTIEFRVPNGSLNPDTWIENARLFGRMVEMAQKTAEIELKSDSERTEEEKAKLDLLESLKNDELDDGEKLEILLDILFTEEEKEVYRRRYEVNSKLYEKISESKRVITKKTKTIDLNRKKEEELHDRDKEAEYHDDLENTLEDDVREELMGLLFGDDDDEHVKGEMREVAENERYSDMEELMRESIREEKENSNPQFDKDNKGE